MFGGFLRFDVVKLADELDSWPQEAQTEELKKAQNQFGTEQNWTALQNRKAVCVSATMHLDYDASVTDLVAAESRQFFTIMEGSSILPINRIFRIVGEWTGIKDATAPYDTD